MVFLHSFLCFTMLVSGFLVAFSRSPIESVLSLILTFCNAAAILFIFNVEFLGLTFIIIYVGAIAVLFLFVIMMLNVKSSEDIFFKVERTFLGMLVLLFSSIFLWVMLWQEEIFFFFSKNNLFFLMDGLNNIDVLGQFLFNYYLVCFLLAGLILLIALIGSIILTLRFDSFQKNQIYSRQLARSNTFLSFFK